MIHGVTILLFVNNSCNKLQSIQPSTTLTAKIESKFSEVICIQYFKNSQTTWQMGRAMKAILVLKFPDTILKNLNWNGFWEGTE